MEGDRLLLELISKAQNHGHAICGLGSLEARLCEASRRNGSMDDASVEEYLTRTERSATGIRFAVDRAAGKIHCFKR